MTEHIRLSIISFALAVFLMACAAATALVATPAPSPTPSPAASSTPLPPPTLTLIPIDLTPDTPVPSATVDPASPDFWACKIRSQTPKSGAKFDSKERFDMAWQVENFGYGLWEPDLIRVTYFSGTRMQVNDSVKLKEVVPTDRWTQLVVPMVAPRASGRYTTVWAMWYGDLDFCHMTVSIVVR